METKEKYAFWILIFVVGVLVGVIFSQYSYTLSNDDEINYFYIYDDYTDKCLLANSEGGMAWIACDYVLDSPVLYAINVQIDNEKEK